MFLRTNRFVFFRRAYKTVEKFDSGRIYNDGLQLCTLYKKIGGTIVALIIKIMKCVLLHFVVVYLEME